MIKRELFHRPLDLTAGILFAILTGLVQGTAELLGHRYLQYGMGRSALITLQMNLNRNLLFLMLLTLFLYLLWRRAVNRERLNPQKTPFCHFLLWHLMILILINFLLRTFLPRYAPLRLLELPARQISRLLLGIVSPGEAIAALSGSLLPLLTATAAALVGMALWRRFYLGLQSSRPPVPRRQTGGWTVAVAALLLTGILAVNLRVCRDRVHRPPRGPNILLIVVDTLRADYLSLYGHPVTSTPHLQALARDSILFHRALSPAPWTSPSVASLFTSQYPAALGFAYDAIRVAPVFLTWAEILREARYRTAGIISHTFLSRTFGFDQGFDSYDESGANGHGFISSPLVTRKALSFLRRHDRQRFFLFLHYFDPHFDYILHPSFDYFPGYRGPVTSGMPIEDLRRITPRLQPADIRYVRSLYQSEISYTDYYLGRLISGLKKQGLYDDTLVIFTADHGEEFCERPIRWIGHTRTVFQEQVHVPLLIKLPRQKMGGLRITRRVGLWDLLPTILALSGLDLPQRYPLQGEAVDFTDGPAGPDSYQVVQTRRHADLAAIIRGEWKMIADYQRNTRQLFHLGNDPGERRDLADRHPDVLNRLSTFLARWHRQMDQVKKHFHIRRGKPPALSKDQKENLRSLGYLD